MERSADLVGAFLYRIERAVKNTELGVITSDALYQTTARTSPYINADAYTELTITSKELRHTRAWLWTP